VRNYKLVRKEPVAISSISPETRALAERLVAFEAAVQQTADDDAMATCRVCEKLRDPLITLTGTAGYCSLLSRALTLAKREAAVLHAVEVQPDGSLNGLKGEAAKSHPIVVAHLLGLLVTFIGEDLTMRLVDDIWPNFSGSDPISSGRNQNETAQ
jgi:hypothetical protein